MELSIEPCQHVTWKVHDYSQLPSEKGYSLDSPEIRCADDSYCLRLWPNLDKSERFGLFPTSSIDLVRLTSTIPERQVSYKIGQRVINNEGKISDNYDSALSTHPILRSFFDECTLTILCSMRLREETSARNPQAEEAKTSDPKEEQEGSSEQSTFYVSRWRPYKMELLVESQCQSVTWYVRDFFQLPSDIGYSLDSREFRFVGDRYCLRLYPNGGRSEDTTDIQLQLVRLTSNFPERIALCKVGCRWIAINGAYAIDRYDGPCTLKDDFLFWPSSRSNLEKMRVMFVPDDTLTVLCFMRLREQSSPGSLESEEAGTEDKQEGLPSMAELESDSGWFLTAA